MVATTYTGDAARPGYFYVWMAGACALFAFGAFAGTYWLQLAAGTFVKGSSLLHLHAGLFSAWTLLLVSQTWLEANGKLDHHRAWGLAGIALAGAMVVVGLALAIHSVSGYLAQGYGNAARAFFWLPAAGIVEFAVFFGLAVANRHRTEWHRRFMLAGTVGLLQAAAARIGFLITTGGGPGARPGLGPPVSPATGIQATLMVSLLLVALAIYDWRTRGRPHPATLIGLGVLLAIAFAGPVVTTTGPWLSFVDGMLTFGR